MRAITRLGENVPIGTAFHDRTLPLCESLNYREWSGYYAVSVYEMHHEHEYNAIRNAAALFDVTPLFKYFISGKDATKFVNRVITRDINKVKVGQVIYCCWCDEDGKVIDDGTISRLTQDTYRWTAADPSIRWFQQNALGLDVNIEDITDQVAALALQGPTSGRLLQRAATADITNLKYFRFTRGNIGGVDVDISRTGYTGDLGYEVWIPWAEAGTVWDALMEAGQQFDIHPANRSWADFDRSGLFQQQEGADRVAEIFTVRNRTRAAGGFEERTFHRAHGAGRRKPARPEAAADGN
jgi:aminomethyltransferase